MIETLIGIRAQLVALQDQVSKLIDAEAARLNPNVPEEGRRVPRMMGGRRAAEPEQSKEA